MLYAATGPLLLSVTVQGEDWPQFRGPNRDGGWNEAGILQHFPDEGLEIRWRASIGKGFSSPVVSAGRVYVTDVEVEDRRILERGHCFDEKSGKFLWQLTAPKLPGGRRPRLRIHRDLLLDPPRR